VLVNALVRVAEARIVPAKPFELPTATIARIPAANVRVIGCMATPPQAI
jgi:hypothetical protein